MLHPIFLRGRDATDPVRLRNERVNALIRPMAYGVRVVWMDLRPLFSNPDGTISPDMMKDFLHLTSAPDMNAGPTPLRPCWIRRWARALNKNQ